MCVSNAIRNDIEQVIEDEKWDDPGHQTGEDRSRSKSAQEEQDEGNRADAHKRHDFGRGPYHYELLLFVIDMCTVNRWVGILEEIKCARSVVTNLISPFFHFTMANTISKVKVSKLKLGGLR